MSIHERMASDIGKNIISQIRPILDLNMKIAQAGGVPSDELAIMCMKIAASITNAMVLAVIQLRKDGVDPASFYDTTIGYLPAFLAPLKAEGLAVVAAHETKSRAQS